MEQRQQPHFLIVTFSAQGHINPSLQFAKRLVRVGARVTFATAVSAYRRMSRSPAADGITFTGFSDGYDDGFDYRKDDPAVYMVEMKRRSSENLAELIKSSVSQNEEVGSGNGSRQPFTCLVYTQLLPWAAEVARAFHIPYALLWIQPALAFDVYYYYFYGYGNLIQEMPNGLIQLPRLPPLAGQDLPSFMVTSKSSDLYSAVLSAFKEQMESLVEETNPRILVNTFDALEPEALRAVDKFKMTGIGPLLPSEFLEGKDQKVTGYGVDLFRNSLKEKYTEWLSSKSKASVAYVSFGSITVLEKLQMEEIARGLLDSGRPFMWVIRDKDNKNGEDEAMTQYMEELNRKGMVVPWCSQVEVLSHEAVGCFVTHCGWSSTLESLVAGMPVVAFPQWTDQGTNAKIIVDVCRTGVRVKPDEDGIVHGDEIKRCLELVMGEGDEFRVNASKWKDLAREAAEEGGSSDANVKAFVDEF